MEDRRIEDKIKEQAEQIPVPDTLQPEQMEKRLRQVKQKRTGVFLTPARRWRMAAGVAAACLVLVVGAVWFAAGGWATGGIGNDASDGSAVSEIGKDAAGREAAPAVPVERVTGTSYDLLCESVNAYNTRMKKELMARDYENENFGINMDDVAGVSRQTEKFAGTDNAVPEDFSDTDTQVAGIMEGDIVKTDGNYLYVAKDILVGSEVRIYKADGRDTSRLSKISVEGEDIQELYLSGKCLILVSVPWDDETGSESSEGGLARSQTRLCLYDISDPQKPTKLAEHSQSGNYNTSRLADGYLYTFSDYQAEGDKNKPEKPGTFVPEVDGSVLREQDIEMLTKDDDNSYMVMTSLKIDRPDEFTDTFSAFGGSDVYYMNSERIYATRAEEEDRTRITRFGYSDGVFAKEASTKVRGQIENSYYMHEYNGYFCFVYTRYRKNNTTNGICVMDDKLKLVGHLDELGNDETIYASYFIDHMAYFVTFYETDPVFAVDLSNPEKPKLKSELKLPGFSEYLHSFGEGQLLGIGRGAGKEKDALVLDSVKFSIFTYNGDDELKEKSSFLVASYTESIAGENHKAVFVDEERGLVGLGIEREGIIDTYQVYRYAGGKWKRVLKQKNISSVDRTRGLRIGEYFYVVDADVNICVYNLENFELLKKVK